jgi:hypothetical protein
MVNAMPRSINPREGPGNHCGGWVGPRASLDGCGKPRPHRFRSPLRLARSQSLYRLRYLGPRWNTRRDKTKLIAEKSSSFRPPQIPRGLSYSEPGLLLSRRRAFTYCRVAPTTVAATCSLSKTGANRSKEGVRILCF